MSLPVWAEQKPEGVVLRLHLQPGAKRTEVSGVHGDALKVRIQAPPVEGKANEELIRFLAKRIGCRRAAVTIVSGELSREKRVLIEGVEASAVLAALAVDSS